MISEDLKKSIVDSLINAVHPKKIFLFGSYAYGHPSDESDLDILVIKDGFDKFHLQQAVKKFLKSLLSFHGVALEKTHDIEAIAKKIKANSIELPSYIEELYDLSEYAVEGRYGQIHDDRENIEPYSQVLNHSDCLLKIALGYNNVHDPLREYAMNPQALHVTSGIQESSPTPSSQLNLKRE